MLLQGSDTSAPGMSDTSAPGVSDNSAAGVSDTSSSGVSDTSAPGVSDTSASGVGECSAYALPLGIRSFEMRFRVARENSNRHFEMPENYIVRHPSFGKCLFGCSAKVEKDNELDYHGLVRCLNTWVAFLVGRDRS